MSGKLSGNSAPSGCCSSMASNLSPTSRTTVMSQHMNIPSMNMSESCDTCECVDEGVQVNQDQFSEHSTIMRNAKTQNGEVDASDCFCSSAPCGTGTAGKEVRFSKGTSPMRAGGGYPMPSFTPSPAVSTGCGGAMYEQGDDSNDKCLCHIKIGIGSQNGSSFKNGKHPFRVNQMRKRPTWKHGSREEPRRPRKDLYKLGGRYIGKLSK